MKVALRLAPLLLLITGALLACSTPATRESGRDAARAVEAAERLAALQLQDGEAELARRTLTRVLQSHPAAARSDFARLQLAELLLAQNRAAQAQRVARQIKLSRLDAASRHKALRLLAALAARRADPDAQLFWLGRLIETQTAAGEAPDLSIESELADLLAALPDTALRAAAGKLAGRPPAVRVWLQLGLRALESDERARAAAALEEARRASPGPGDDARIAAFARRLSFGGGSLLRALPGFAATGPALAKTRVSGVLGVALPLSGDFADFGEEALSGVALAAGLFAKPGDESSPPSALQLRIVDTRIGAAAATAAVETLAAEPQVLAIIGGLLSPASEAAAATARRTRVPLLALGLRERAGAARDFVLRLGRTPRLDAEQVAAYASETLGLSRFAILYPDVPYGRALRAAFWDAVEARGGEVVSISRYAADATDFSTPIRRLIGYELLSEEVQEALALRDRLRKRAKRLPPEAAAALRAEAAALTGPELQPLPPFVDFEALFIPDSYENVGLIAPHLAFHGVRGVRLLGGSPWHAPELLSLAGRHLNGAVFSAGSFGASERPALSAFNQRYHERFGAPPGDLAAAAFDATHLAILALAQGAATRADMLRELRRERSFAGVSGWLSVGPEGLRRRSHLLGVDHGRLMSIDERGAPPYLYIPLPECEPEPAPDAGDAPHAIAAPPEAATLAEGAETPQCIPPGGADAPPPSR